MKAITYRRATGADASRLAALHAESWRETYRAILPQSYLAEMVEADLLELWHRRVSIADSERQYVLLGVDEGRLIGFACVLLDEEPEMGACLDNLHILPSFQHRGLGRELFAKAAIWIKSVEPGWPVHLWVFEQNTGARRFYDSLHGTVVKRQCKYVAGVEVPSKCYIWTDLELLIKECSRPKE